MQHLLSSQNLDIGQIESLFKRAATFLPTARKGGRLGLAEGKILATLFYEPSTRTRFSFETAMLRLGGQVISNADMSTTSSSKKGETLYDTAKMVSTFADIIAMRHPQAGSVAEFARGSSVPVMNGGDGAGDHPTQGLLDLFTVQQELGTLEGLTWMMVGDLKNSRVVHSQCEYLRHFKKSKFILVSMDGIRLPAELVKSLEDVGHEVVETNDMMGNVGEVDVISHTRIQEERFADQEEYVKYKSSYVITPKTLETAKKEMVLIHPLPRVDELDPAVDDDPRAKYFVQVEYGVALRMALIAELLGV